LRASTSKVRFAGFLAVYTGGADGGGGSDGAGEADRLTATDRQTMVDEKNGNGDGGYEPRADQMEGHVPVGLVEEERLDLLRLLPEQHFTQPPFRYSEASLIRSLEENGIGRPSTYATIMSTIIDRGYVERAERKLLPTELGITVNDLLVKHFDTVLNVGFTADMEEHLDNIAAGQEALVPVLHDFYDFFAPQLHRAEESMQKVWVEPERTGESCPDCGNELIIKLGRFGKFVACSNYPTCRFTKPLVAKIGVTCPLDGGDLVERRTKRGRTFYGCANYPSCDFTSWKRPLPQPCPKCGGLLVLAAKEWAECEACHERVRLNQAETGTAELADAKENGA
jgi:DNA topoisomerase-1